MTSGLTPSFTFEKITIGSVLAPGPDTKLEITNQIFYGNDNIASRPLIDPRILADAALYPTPEIEARLYRSAEVSAATERIRTRTWTRIKTAD